MTLEQSQDRPHVQGEAHGLGYYLGRIFGVVARGQTYLNLLYLLLAFPLGLLYFVTLVVGFSLGFSLLILLVGIVILLIMLAVWIAFGAFERQLAIWLLREDIPPMTPRRLREQPGESAVSWDGFVAYLGNPATWTSLVYLFAKLPLGIISFTALVGAVTLTGLFLTAPLTYSFVQPEVYFTWNSVWVIDTLGDALLAFLIGIPLLFISLHVLNGLAWVSGKFAKIMLGTAGYAAAQEEAPAQVAAIEAAAEAEALAMEPSPELATEPAEEPAPEPAAVAPAPERRVVAPHVTRHMETHVKVLGWLYIALGILGVLTAGFVFFVLVGSGMISGDQEAIAILSIVATVVGGLLLLISAPGIVTGVGLLYHRSWGRVLGIILAILNLPSFPIGTAVGAYGLWVLLQDDASRIFT